MLPDNILGFEAIAVQPVPGQALTAAEGVYQTTDMKLDMQIATGEYVRVEGFATPELATKRAAAIVAQYPADQHQVLVNKTTPARVGFSADRGTWATVWPSGQYVVYVKAFFKDHIPVDKKHFLDNPGAVLASAVELYQRTGKQGVDAQKYMDAPLPGSASVGSGIGNVPQLGAP